MDSKRPNDALFAATGSRTWSLGNMLNSLKVAGLIQVGEMIARAEEMYYDPDNLVVRDGVTQLNDEAWSELKETLEAMAVIAGLFGLTNIGKVIKNYMDGDHPIDQSAFNAARDFFQQSLDDTKMLQLDAKQSEMYLNVDYFDQDILDAFPSSFPELDDAVSCFAVTQYTAAVYHALRAIEVPLLLMANNFGITKFSNWNTALNDMEKLIRNRDATKFPANWNQEKAAYTEAISHLFLIKNAWRNHTMHLKLRFTESDAEEILIAVRAFLRKAAKVVKES